MLWEDALTSFASSTQGDVQPRASVAGSGSPTWIKSGNQEIVTSLPASSPWSYYVWFSFLFGGETYYYIVWVNIDYATVDAAGSPLSLFSSQPTNILQPLLYAPGENDQVSGPSFDAAMMALANIDTWLTDWMPKINGWADAIGDTGSDWQGSAAAAFKWTLLQFAGELQNLHVQLNTPMNRWTDLYYAGIQQFKTFDALNNAFTAWQSNTYCGPLGCIGEAIAAAMNGVSLVPTSNSTYYGGYYGGSYGPAYPTMTINAPGYGSPTDSSFWTAIEATAKQNWLANVTNVLDAVATPAMATLGTSYQTAINGLGSLVQITLEAPPTDVNVNGGPNTGDGSSGNLNLNTNTGDPNINTGDPTITGGGSGGAGNLNLGNTNTGANTNTPDDLATITGGGSGGAGNLGTNTNTGDPDFAVTGGGSGANLNTADDEPSEDTITGPNGNTLDDSAGDPIEVPAGSTISSDGEVIGPNGSPVLGANGQPLTVPKGSTIGQSNGAAGNVVVPQGSKINTNGTVTGPNGKEVLDSNGNPLVLAKGSTIGADGTVLGPNGKAVPLSSQLLTDQEQALSGPGSTVLTGTGDGSVAALQTSVPTVGGAQITGTGTGMDQASLDHGGVPTETSLATTGTATTSSDDGLTSALGSGTGSSTGTTSGTSSTTSSGDEMPMMPGGMGGGGMGQQGGQDRQRTTWLAEEEEVWGTDIDAVSGTIGR
jgi:hypothetical protein